MAHPQQLPSMRQYVTHGCHSIKWLLFTEICRRFDDFGQDLIVFIHLSLFSWYWIVRSVIVDLNVQHMSLNSV